MKKNILQIINKITQSWFLSEPLLFSTFCTHDLVSNEKLNVPFRTGKKRIEYSPKIIESLNEDTISELLKIEIFRILLKHPYQRQPIGANKAYLTIASDILLTANFNLNVKLEGVNIIEEFAIRLSLLKDSFSHKIKELNNKGDVFYPERLKGFNKICGIDEAGRGPLAGPVVAAVVVFKPGTKIEGINDSKKLSEAKRNELFDIIKNEALDYGIGIVQRDEIDEYNILNATYMAMKKAINCLKKSPDYLLVDAAHIPDIDIAQKAIIKGDSKSISIAAASILAKVTRDSLMYEYDKMYPEYGFSSHKGYGTDQHYQAIRQHGITPIHRKSFLKNIL